MTKKLEILVIDDEEPLRFLLSAIIKGEGENPTTAKDGNEGIALYLQRHGSSNPFDIVITDIRMKNGNGKDVYERVKQISPDTPIYVISGTHIRDGYALPDGFPKIEQKYLIGKPFNNDDITRIIKEHKPIKESSNPSLDKTAYGLFGPLSCQGYR